MTKKTNKMVIQNIIDGLPFTMREKAQKQFQDYVNSKREKLSPEVVERLYLQVIQEAKERGR